MSRVTPSILVSSTLKVAQETPKVNQGQLVTPMEELNEQACRTAAAEIGRMILANEPFPHIKTKIDNLRSEKDLNKIKYYLNHLAEQVKEMKAFVKQIQPKLEAAGFKIDEGNVDRKFE